MPPEVLGTAATHTQSAPTSPTNVAPSTGAAMAGPSAPSSPMSGPSAGTTTITGSATAPAPAQGLLSQLQSLFHLPGMGVTPPAPPPTAPVTAGPSGGGEEASTTDGAGAGATTTTTTLNATPPMPYGPGFVQVMYGTTTVPVSAAAGLVASGGGGGGGGDGDGDDGDEDNDNDWDALLDEVPTGPPVPPQSDEQQAQEGGDDTVAVAAEEREEGQPEEEREEEKDKETYHIYIDTEVKQSSENEDVSVAAHPPQWPPPPPLAKPPGPFNGAMRIEDQGVLSAMLHGRRGLLCANLPLPPTIAAPPHVPSPAIGVIPADDQQRLAGILQLGLMPFLRRLAILCTIAKVSRGGGEGQQGGGDHPDTVDVFDEAYFLLGKPSDDDPLRSTKEQSGQVADEVALLLEKFAPMFGLPTSLDAFLARIAQPDDDAAAGASGDASPVGSEGMRNEDDESAVVEPSVKPKTALEAAHKLFKWMVHRVVRPLGSSCDIPLTELLPFVLPPSDDQGPEEAFEAYMRACSGQPEQPEPDYNALKKHFRKHGPPPNVNRPSAVRVWGRVHVVGGRRPTHEGGVIREPLVRVANQQTFKQIVQHSGMPWVDMGTIEPPAPSDSSAPGPSSPPRVRLVVGTHLPHLVPLPQLYQTLFTKNIQRKLTTPTGELHVSRRPGICLGCGTRLCFDKCCATSIARRDDTKRPHFRHKSIINEHCSSCGVSNMMLLELLVSVSYNLHPPRIANWGALHLDRYGEEDRNMTRGKPLWLNSRRLTQLVGAVTHQNFPLNEKANPRLVWVHSPFE